MESPAARANWEPTTFRVRPRHEQAWEDAVYMANAQKFAPGMSFRVCQITAGMAGANYMIFTSVESYAAFDQSLAEGMAMWEKVSPQDMATLQGIMQIGVESVITNRYSLSPSMSYVDDATKATASRVLEPALM